MAWQVHEAKNRFSELVRAAERGGPQIITVRGKRRAVQLSTESYRRLAGRQGSLVELFRRSPWAEIELDRERPADPGQPIEL